LVGLQLRNHVHAAHLFQQSLFELALVVKKTEIVGAAGGAGSAVLGEIFGVIAFAEVVLEYNADHVDLRIAHMLIITPHLELFAILGSYIIICALEG
jgi:hypothetical protein